MSVIIVLIAQSIIIMSIHMFENFVTWYVSRSPRLIDQQWSFFVFQLQQFQKHHLGDQA